MLLNIFLLRNYEQDASQKTYMWHGLLAGNLILLSIVFLCIAIFYALSSSIKLGQDIDMLLVNIMSTCSVVPYGTVIVVCASRNDPRRGLLKWTNVKFDLKVIQFSQNVSKTAKT